MPSPLVRTKLYIPRTRPGQVSRPRLAHRPDGTASPRLTLVSAPAGFGKTTLLASWVETTRASGRAVAWVSLGETEREPAEFWTYVVTALDGAVPGVGTGALSLLAQPHPPIETVVTLVLNELSGHPEGLLLVLDDYHLVDGPAVSADLAFLLQHLPPRVQMMIGTRADPSLRLGGLRARGELIEVRAGDLRFTLAETASYLHEAVGAELTAGEVAALESRTEGWIAALQLAALSLRGRADVAGFIDGFAGDDRYVVDYLVEEVIGRQPDSIRAFLLETSILQRLSGPLCDAVTGGADGRLVLEHLERSNLFVVPLDDTRTWYRYHHLFAEVLRAHLVHTGGGKAADLHRRAARWCADHDEPAPAVRHALAAGDVELAADVVETVAIGMLRDRQEATVLGWVDLMPPAVVRRRPVLAVALIGASMSSGRLDGVEERLDDLQRALDDPPGDTVVLDPQVLPRLPGTMETYRAALSLSRGEAAATVVHADRALALAAPGDDLTVAAAAALSGLASWGSGDLVAAHRSYSAAVEGLQRAGNHSDVLGCSITLADLLLTQGRLDDAVETYEVALRLADRHGAGGGAVLRGTADMVLGLGQIALERGDLEAVAHHERRVEVLGEQAGLPQHPYRWRVARARALEVQGDLAGAIALLDEADRVYVGDFSPNVRPVPAQRARVLVALGRLAEALEWARGAHVSATDELDYVREYEHVTLARILLGQHRLEGSETALGAASGLLERLAVAADEGGRSGTLVEVLLLRALAHQARHGRHDGSGTLVLLERALRLAEPQGLVRVVVAEGPPMRSLLEALVRKDPSWAYPRRLLGTAAAASGPVPVGDLGLVDPLSARELDVLRLLATDLDGPAIARELVVSINTVRTHTKSIYAKLGVSSRRAAITRAGELGLPGLPGLPVRR